jgi:hypothetical protein
MLIFALLIQTATPEPAVKITPTGDDSYMLELITNESADIAATKMKAAAEEACAATKVASTGMVIVETVGKKPKQHQILQPVRCKPAPTP